MFTKVSVDSMQLCSLLIGVGHKEVDVEVVFSSEELCDFFTGFAMKVRDELFCFFDANLVIFVSEFPVITYSCYFLYACVAT